MASLPAERTWVIVVEDDTGAIVGCWALFTVCHAEGLWIAPAHRGKASVGRRLWRRVWDVVRGTGSRSFVTAAIDPQIHALLSNRAVALPQEYVVCLPQ